MSTPSGVMTCRVESEPRRAHRARRRVDQDGVRMRAPEGLGHVVEQMALRDPDERAFNQGGIRQGTEDVKDGSKTQFASDGDQVSEGVDGTLAQRGNQCRPLARSAAR